MNSQAPAWSFSNRRKLAYLLGILDDGQNRDLTVLADIRNYFAHTPTPKLEETIDAIVNFASRAFPDNKPTVETESSLVFWLTAVWFDSSLGRRLKEVEHVPLPPAIELDREIQRAALDKARMYAAVLSSEGTLLKGGQVP